MPKHETKGFTKVLDNKTLIKYIDFYKVTKVLDNRTLIQYIYFYKSNKGP